jgi:hypothetical protein
MAASDETSSPATGISNPLKTCDGFIICNMLQFIGFGPITIPVEDKRLPRPEDYRGSFASV